MSKFKIVVVDDNKNDLLMAKFVILRMGLQPILLESPKKLLETLRNNLVAVIILDYEMPEMSGLELLKKVKKVSAFAKIPIVMLTGNSSVLHVKNTVSQGAVDYIVKPVDPSIFESKINRILKSDFSADKSNWIEYQLQKNSTNEIRVFNFCHVVSLGELSLTLKTNQEYPVGYTFFTDSPLFTELEIKNPALKVESSTMKEGYCLVQCSLLGLSESELKKIRLYQKLLIHNKSA